MGIVKEKSWLKGCFGKKTDDGPEVFLGYVLPTEKITTATTFTIKDGENAGTYKVKKIRYYINKKDLFTATPDTAHNAYSYTVSFNYDFSYLNLSHKDDCVDISNVIGYVNDNITEYCNVKITSYDYDFSYAFFKSNFGQIYDNDKLIPKLKSKPQTKVITGWDGNKFTTKENLFDINGVKNATPSNLAYMFGDIIIEDNISDYTYGRKENIDSRDFNSWNEYCENGKKARNSSTFEDSLVLALVPEELHALKIDTSKPGGEERLEETSNITYTVNNSGSGLLQLYRYTDKYLYGNWNAQIIYAYRPKNITACVSKKGIATFTALPVENDINNEYVDKPFAYISIWDDKNPADIQIHKPLPNNKKLRLTGMIMGGITHDWDLSILTPKITGIKITNLPSSVNVLSFEQSFDIEGSSYENIKTVSVSIIPEYSRTEGIMCLIQKYNDTDPDPENIIDVFVSSDENEEPLITQNSCTFSLRGKAPGKVKLIFYPKERTDISTTLTTTILSTNPTKFELNENVTAEEHIIYVGATLDLYKFLNLEKDGIDLTQSANLRSLIPITWTKTKGGQILNVFEINQKTGKLYYTGASDVISNDITMTIKAQLTDYPNKYVEIQLNVFNVPANNVIIDPNVITIPYYKEFELSFLYTRGNEIPKIDWNIPQEYREDYGENQILQIIGDEKNNENPDLGKFNVKIVDYSRWYSSKEIKNIRLEATLNFNNTNKKLTNYALLNLINPAPDKVIFDGLKTNDVNDPLIYSNENFSYSEDESLFEIRRSSTVTLKFRLYDSENTSNDELSTYLNDIKVSSTYPFCLKVNNYYTTYESHKKYKDQNGNEDKDKDVNTAFLYVELTAEKLVNGVWLKITTGNAQFNLVGNVIKEKITDFNVTVGEDTTITVTPGSLFMLNFELKSNGKTLNIEEFKDDINITIENTDIIHQRSITEYKVDLYDKPIDSSEITIKISDLDEKKITVNFYFNNDIGVGLDTYGFSINCCGNSKIIEAQCLNISPDSDRISEYQFVLNEDSDATITYCNYFSEDNNNIKDENTITSVNINNLTIDKLFELTRLTKRKYEFKAKSFKDIYEAGIAQNLISPFNVIKSITVPIKCKLILIEPDEEKPSVQDCIVTINNNYYNSVTIESVSNCAFDVGKHTANISLSKDSEEKSDGNKYFIIHTSIDEYNSKEERYSNFNKIYWSKNQTINYINNGDDRYELVLNMQSFRTKYEIIKDDNIEPIYLGGVYNGSIVDLILAFKHTYPTASKGIESVEIENVTKQNDVYKLMQYNEYTLTYTFDESVTYKKISFEVYKSNNIDKENTLSLNVLDNKVNVFVNKYSDSELQIVIKCGDTELKRVRIETQISGDSLQLNPSSKIAHVGEIFDIEVISKTPGEFNYNWSISNSNCEIINNNNTKITVKAKQLTDDCTITASVQGQSAEAKCKIKVEHIYVNRFELNIDRMVYTEGSVPDTTFRIQNIGPNDHTYEKFKYKINNNNEYDINDVSNITLNTSSWSVGTYNIDVNSYNERDELTTNSRTLLIVINPKPDEQQSE